MLVFLFTAACDNILAPWLFRKALEEQVTHRRLKNTEFLEGGYYQ